MLGSKPLPALFRFDPSLMETQDAPTRWRSVVTAASLGAENMALDEALMERARATGESVVRVYAWSRPTISLGRNQTANGLYDLDRIRELGLDVVRRPTGGRAILHHREITYSVTSPAGESSGLSESYKSIYVILLDALSRLGVHAAIAAPARKSAPPSMSPCFNEPSAGELTFDGRKLAGSAQWRADGALLQHGSILIADDQSILSTLAVQRGPDIPAPATLLDALGFAPSLNDVAGALTDAIESIDGVRPTGLVLDDAIRARTSDLVVRYSDTEWTWRR
jgi:lipoyl(octanoyl) transferase